MDLNLYIRQIDMTKTYIDGEPIFRLLVHLSF